MDSWRHGFWERSSQRPYAQGQATHVTETGCNCYAHCACAGQWVKIEVSIASSYWPDFNTFPCPTSTYAAGQNACDFWYHGSQTRAGSPRAVSPPAGLCLANFSRSRISSTSITASLALALYKAPNNETLLHAHGWRAPTPKPLHLALPLLQVLNDGAVEIPLCCPEGVLFYNPPDPAMYDVALSQSPYTLAAAGR
jgi:hypothetical protein